MFRRSAFLLAIWIPLLGAAEDPAVLQIRIVEGDGAIYPLGSRATRGITIQVSDETGKPVDGATVSFRLPEDGPGGMFASSSKTEIATTRADGRVAVWGMQWNRVAGSFEVRVTAVKGTARAGTVCSQYLTETPEPAAKHGGGHKLLWIALAIAGGAGAGAVIGGRAGSNSTTSTTSAVNVVRIGSPTIAIGHP